MRRATSKIDGVKSDTLLQGGKVRKSGVTCDNRKIVQTARRHKSPEPKEIGRGETPLDLQVTLKSQRKNAKKKKKESTEGKTKKTGSKQLS